MIDEPEIFEAAAALPVEERAAYLDLTCAGHPEARAWLEELLRSHNVSGFMEIRAALDPMIRPDSASLQPEAVGERIGHYKLMEEIGQGGFGTVWVAEQERPVRRRVALKIIKLGMDTKEVIARFEQERQALAMMDHPHIAKVFDAGATEWGRPYFVMELVRGIKITDYCDQANLPTPERLALFIQVCNAVQHAHQKGIIHRDLKPSNILVTLHDGVPMPKVIDFGVAKATQQRLTDLTIYTQFEQMIGTPLYMSPEQAEMSGLDVDTRSDIYSLGVLLYELLTGRTPFDPDELMQQGLDEIRRTIRQQEPKKPSTFLDTMAFERRNTVAQHRQVEGAKLVGLIRGDLDWIVMMALEKDRNRRYETASDFARDIQRFLESKPVSAAAPSASYRFGKFARRNKAALGIAALIFTILVAATGVSVWQAKVAIAAKKDALAKASAERAAREDAEAISTFLTEVFQSPDPRRDGRTITVAETLDRTVKKLEDDLAGQPDLRARLYLVLGTTYQGLGLHREAIPIEEKARDHYLKFHGPEHPETLAANYELAKSYAEAGRWDEALKMQEELLALSRNVRGPEHQETLKSMGLLARSYAHTGRWHDALKMREELLKLRRKVLGPEDPHTVWAIAQLAGSYADVGRRDEALKMREEALTLHRKVFGPEHPDALWRMADLACSYADVGRRDEALKLREEALPLNRKVFGSEHTSTLWAMIDLACSYADAGRRNDALKMREEVLKLTRKANGPEHPDTLLVMDHLANSYHDTGRRDEALPMRETVLGLRRKIIGPEHPDTLWSMTNLAMSYHDAGRLDEALKLREEVLTLQRNVNGPEHPNTLLLMDHLASSYHDTGRRDEALSIREAVLGMRRRIIGPEHPDTLWSMTNLAHSYHDAGRLDEALKLREEVLTLRRKVSGPEHADTIRTMDDLMNSYTAAGRLEEALPLLVLLSALHPEDTFLTQKVSVLQAWFGKEADCAATCRRALELAAGTDDPSTADRAAKGCCLLPSSDPKLLENALALARRAVDLGKQHQYLPYYQLALGMAEYRSGSYPAADEALTASELAGKDNRHVRDTARFFHAMSLFQQGKASEARRLLAKAAAETKPLPAAARQPFASGTTPDDLIVWLAYKEAKTLLHSSR